jgi:hypothetical protein
MMWDTVGRGHQYMWDTVGRGHQYMWDTVGVVMQYQLQQPTYNKYLFWSSHTVLNCGGNVIISSCVCDEKEGTVKGLGAGAAGPAFVASRTSAWVM